MTRIDFVATLLFNVVVAVALAAYLRNSLRNRAAVGLWWDFLRDEEPIRYWIQLGIVALAIVNALSTFLKLIVGTSQ